MRYLAEMMADGETQFCVSALSGYAQTVRVARRRYALIHRAKNGFFSVSVLLLLSAVSAFAQVGKNTSIVEISGPGKTVISAEKLAALCRKHGVPNSGIYRWQNHLIAYGKTANIRAVNKNLLAIYPSAQVKFYDAPFYKFDRQYCTDKRAAKQWDTIILTCNLVADKSKQQEYLNYHATQFQKWPEVAQGFCNAGFQQLLVFRQRRQLMLIISIPHGASLDELNPRTTLNNPRVGEWNTLMKQYQTGLSGTKPGEVWVFLKPVVAVKQVR